MKPLIIAGCLLALAGTALADDEECPPAFKGATVTPLPASGGAQLEFRTGHRENVEDLRIQLRAVGEMIEQHGTEKQTTSDAEVVQFPPVDIDVKDITLGARVTVRASRLRDRGVVRDLAYGFAEFWKTSACVEQLVSARESREPKRRTR